MIKSSNAILFGVLAIGAGAAIFASRQPDTVAVPTPEAAPVPSALQPGIDPNAPLPAGHPPIDNNLPAGHPPIDSPSAPAVAPAGDVGLTWTVPAKWKQVPHPSAMRLATYRIPKADGVLAEAEMSVTRAGGNVEANAQRWVDQFDPPSRPSVKRSTRTVGTLKVHIVDGAGGFTTMTGGVEQGWALLGAIVETPDGSHFFKLTGPKKSVSEARSDFDSLIATVRLK